MAEEEKPQSESPCLPTPKPRKINEYVRESQLLLWIWRMISEVSFGNQYEQYLRDGVVLCQLIQALVPDGNKSGDSSKKSPIEKGDDKTQKQINIESFLERCRLAFNMNDEELFEVEDLLSMQDIPRVTRCLFTLGKYAAEKNQQQQKPELGKPYDEWLEEQLQQQSKNRRSGMPIGDDLYVSHVDTTWVKDKLEKRKAWSLANIQRPPSEPLIQRTPSKPVSELKSIFSL